MKHLQEITEGMFDVDDNLEKIVADLPVEFAQYFSVIWNKYKNDDTISFKEGQSIFNDFKRLVSELRPQTKKYNFIQKLLRRKNPVMYMSADFNSFVGHYQHGFEICVDLPNRKHWDITFQFPWVDGPDYAPIFDRTKYEFHKFRTDRWRGQDKIENNEYIVRVISDEIVDKIKNLNE